MPRTPSLPAAGVASLRPAELLSLARVFSAAIERRAANNNAFHSEWKIADASTVTSSDRVSVVVNGTRVNLPSNFPTLIRRAVKAMPAGFDGARFLRIADNIEPAFAHFSAAAAAKSYAKSQTRFADAVVTAGITVNTDELSEFDVLTAEKIEAARNAVSARPKQTRPERTWIGDVPAPAAPAPAAKKVGPSKTPRANTARSRRAA